jgi:threonine dehydratase
MSLTFSDIQHAQNRLKAYLAPTPLEPSPELGEHIFLKLENANQTHSFKIRGALNAILALSPQARERGIVTVSSGNHAQGVSYASHLTHTNALILMPKHTPQKKVRGAQRWGAEVMLVGNNYDETEAEGRRLEKEEGLTFVSPYNDLNVMAGAGTIGLEIAQQLPSVQRVVVCVSGGGLIGGIGTALKHLIPTIEVIGVNAESAPAMYNHIHHTHKPEVWETLAQARSVGNIGRSPIW